jgi:ankyrin repeat protein
MAVNAADGYRGYTPLPWLADMAAAGGPRVEILRALLNKGADVNLRSSDGSTPLTLAKAAGSEMGALIAAELVALGAIE